MTTTEPTPAAAVAPSEAGSQAARDRSGRSKGSRRIRPACPPRLNAPTTGCYARPPRTTPGRSAVADIFDEVQEELRAERAKTLLHRYGGLLAGLALLA